MPKYKKKVVSENVEAELTTWGKQEEFEDSKGAIRIRISKNRQHNDRKKKDKRTRRVWRYQKGNYNPYIEEEQTTQ